MYLFQHNIFIDPRSLWCSSHRKKITLLCQSLLTEVTVEVSMVGANPVTEPGDNGASTNLMLCATASIPAATTIEQNTVISLNLIEGTAGIQLQ